MPARLLLAFLSTAGICLLCLGCSEQATSPEPVHLQKGTQLSQPLVFEVTLVDDQQRYVDTETHEIWEADLAWEIDKLISEAPDLVDEQKTSDRDTLDAIRALVEGGASKSSFTALLRSPSDNLTWSELKRTYRPRPPKDEG